MDSDNKTAVTLALITIVLWGTVAAISKLLLASANPYQIVFYIGLFSTISLFLIVLFTKRLQISKDIIKNNFIKVVLLGTIGIGLYFIFYILAFANAPAAQVNVLNYMWPIFMLVFSSIFLKTKLSPKILLAFFLGILGTYIVITKGTFFNLQSEFLMGYMFAIGAAISWAIFSILNSKYKFDPFASLFVYNLFGFLTLTIALIITNSSFFVERNVLLGTAYIGLFPTAIGYGLWLKSLKIGNPLLIANLGHLTPFVSLMFIFILLKETILVSEIIGLVVIVSGVLIQIIKPNKVYRNKKT